MESWNFRRGQLLALALAATTLSGCEWLGSLISPPPVATTLAQGWTDAERSFFYYASQGSRLIRREWFLALERDDSQELFLADGLKRFGYLPGEPGPLNPDRLPIGFVADPPTGREWIGMTCAACHTSELAHGGRLYRIEGGPAAADLYDFLARLELALRKAAGDDAAFARFAARVLGPNDTPANRAVLRDDPLPSKGLRAFAESFRKFVAQSTPTAPLKWGPARADAFGMIFNRVTSINLGIDANSQPPDAPVSYPFLWGTSWHDFTQWNGAIPNGGGPILGPIHRMARNVGQVLGVFGTVDFTSDPPYPSSVRRENLLLLEETVAKLTAPEWPAAFGVPDAGKVARGKDLYLSQGCVNCHRLVPRDQQNQPVQVQVVPVSLVGTDEAMTTMAATRTAATGVLQGRLKNPLSGSGDRIGAQELVHDLLSHAVIGVMTHGVFQSTGPAALSGAPQAPQALFNASVVARTYKARPLNGIWATGPYLHNGSVRTLYQLLLPPAQRETAFRVGSREFDPVQVGFADATGVIDFRLDTTLPGNRNTGHVFGTGLNDDDRKALVEYLKTL